MKKITVNSSLGETVADEFRTAAIFKKAGIDFCCGGNKTIGEACKENGIDANQILHDLQSLEEKDIILFRGKTSKNGI